jgi:hypothetical protein
MVKKLVIIIITVTLFISIFIAGYVSNADTKGGLKSKGLAYNMPNNKGTLV